MSAKAAKSSLAKDYPLMGGDYQGTTLVETTPQAFVYRAVDPLGDTHLVSELSLPNLVRRKKNGQIFYAKADQMAQDTLLDRAGADLEMLSRLRHPCLIGIQQRFLQNETLYFSTELPPQSQSAIEISAAKGFYEPTELENLSRKLISVLDYVHSFDVFGFKITPETLVLVDEPVTALVELRRYVDGTVKFQLGDQDCAVSDCKTLAKTIYLLLTGSRHGQASGKLTSNLSGFSSAFLDSLDRMLADDPKMAFSSADDWLRFIQKQDKTGGVNTMVAPAVGWRTGALVGGAAACLLLGAGYFIATQGGSATDAQTDAIAASIPATSAPDAVFENPDLILGADRINWTLNLPLITKSVTGSGDKPKQMLSLPTQDQVFQKSNPWFENGQLLTAVNGTPVSVEFDFEHETLRALQSSEESSVITLTVHDAVLPLERQVALVVTAQAQATLGAVIFAQTPKSGGWELSVAQVLDPALSAFKVGDRVLGSGPTGLSHQTLGEFYRMVKTAQSSGITSIDVAVVTATNQPTVRKVAIANLLDK